MNETTSFLNNTPVYSEVKFKKRKGFLTDLENNQNEYFYKKAGEENKKIVTKVIQMYDFNHSILETLKPHFFTNKLQIALDGYFVERELYIAKMLEKYLNIL
jgi:hypothetical protein